MYFSTSGPVPQKLTVSPQIKIISLPFPVSCFFVSSVASFSFCHATLSIIFTFVSIVITGCFLAAPATSLLFYACFWTSWDWNKNIVLLYSMQYCIVKYTKAKPATEDARMWQCTPDTWADYCDCTRKRTFTPLEVHHLEAHMLGLASIPLIGRQSNLSPEERLQGVTDRSVQRWGRTGAKRQKGTQFSRFFMYRNEWFLIISTHRW